MNPKTNRELITHYLEAIRKDKSAATLDKYIVDDELKQHVAMYDVSFPGYWLEPLDMIAEDDKVFVRATLHGVQNGSFMGAPPSGKKVAAPVYIVYKIAHNKIVAHWLLADMLGVMQQLGMVPAPTAA